MIIGQISVISKIRPNMKELIYKQANLSDYINTTKNWNVQNLQNILLDYFIGKISITHFY